MDNNQNPTPNTDGNAQNTPKPQVNQYQGKYHVGRKFYVVMTVILSTMMVIALAFGLAVSGKMESGDWATLAQWAISNIIAFSSGYIAGNFASKIGTK